MMVRATMNAKARSIFLIKKFIESDLKAPKLIQNNGEGQSLLLIKKKASQENPMDIYFLQFTLQIHHSIR